VTIKAARFAGMQHNRGDHQNFAARTAGIQHNRGEHQSFAARTAGIQHNRGDHQSFAARTAGIQHNRRRRGAGKEEEEKDKTGVAPKVGTAPGRGSMHMDV